MDPCALFWMAVRHATLVKIPTDTGHVYVYEYDSDSEDSWETQSSSTSGRASEVEYDSDSGSDSDSDSDVLDSEADSDFEPVRDFDDNPLSERDPMHDFEPGSQYVQTCAAAGFVCSICRDADSDADSVCQLASCLHEFHLRCIRPWAVRHASCPLCRCSL